MRTPRWLLRTALFGLVALFATTGLAAATAPPGHVTAGLQNTVTKYTSQNWAGYFAAGATHTVTKVSGTWVEPSVSCPAKGKLYAVFWVGIDGANSATVEQTGTLAQCAAGTASYSAWWEMYPLNAAQTIPSMTVHAGDTISATVTFHSGKFTMAITDGTQSFSKTATQTASRTSAECIAERPEIVSGGTATLAHLADFGTAKFSACSGVIGGVTHPIGAFASVGRVNMISTVTSATLAATGNVGSTKGGFSVTWKASF